MSDEPMAQANRFAIVVTALALTFLALLVVLLAWGAPASSITRVADFAGWLRRHNSGETKTVITLGAAVVVLLMLAVIVLELTPSPTQRLRVRNVRSGSATITTREIAQRISDEVTSRVAHVAACDAIVAANGRRVEVALELHVEPGADLSHTANVACGHAQALVEERMGIALSAPPRARLHYRELRLRGGAATPETTATAGEARDERGQPDAPEEAQAAPDRAPGA